MPLPPLSLNASSSSSAKNDGALSNSFDMPFVFDNSGWNVNIKGSGQQSATTSSGPTGGASTGLAMNPQLLMLAAIAYLLLRR